MSTRVLAKAKRRDKRIETKGNRRKTSEELGILAADLNQGKVVVAHGEIVPHDHEELSISQGLGAGSHQTHPDLTFLAASQAPLTHNPFAGLDFKNLGA